MPIPKTKLQTSLLWLAALLISVFISFLAALSEQLKGMEPIQWRVILYDVIQTLLAGIPFVVAGLGLPRLGSEQYTALVSEIGTEKATKVLEQLAISEPKIDYDRLADEILERHRNVKQ